MCELANQSSGCSGGGALKSQEPEQTEEETVLQHRKLMFCLRTKACKPILNITYNIYIIIICYMLDINLTMRIICLF